MEDLALSMLFVWLAAGAAVLVYAQVARRRRVRSDAEGGSDRGGVATVSGPGRVRLVMEADLLLRSVLTGGAAALLVLLLAIPATVLAGLSGEAAEWLSGTVAVIAGLVAAVRHQRGGEYLEIDATELSGRRLWRRWRLRVADVEDVVHLVVGSREPRAVQVSAQLRSGGTRVLCVCRRTDGPGVRDLVDALRRCGISDEYLGLLRESAGRATVPEDRADAAQRVVVAAFFVIPVAGMMWGTGLTLFDLLLGR